MIKNCYQHPRTPPGSPSWCHFMVLPPLSSTSGDSILSDFFSRSQASGNIWRYCWLQQWGVGGTWWGWVGRRLSHNMQHQKQKSLRMPGRRMLAFHKRYHSHSVSFLPCRDLLTVLWNLLIMLHVSGVHLFLTRQGFPSNHFCFGVCVPVC